MESGALLSEVYMARQPIYDGARDVSAYELLFRSGTQNSAGQIGIAESAQAIISSLIDIGLAELVGEKRAFINIDEHLLMSNALQVLPQSKVVLEILETVPPTPENVAAVKELKEMGYIIALDDFELTPLTQPFIPYASIIKFDVRASGPKLTQQAKVMSKQKVSLLAEKVETEQEFKLCLRAGFHYFQGYYFSRPEIIKGAGVPSNRLAALRVAAELQNPEISIEQLEQIIGADLALTHRLLKLVSSAHLGLAARVASIRQTVMFLGVRTVASVATLLAMSASSNKPAELANVAFLRAKMCELLAVTHGKSAKERFFTAGLLSLIDAMMDLPMETVLAELPLDKEIHNALLDPHFDNDVAAMMRIVLAYEEGDFDRIEALVTDASHVGETYRSAAQWANSLNKSLQASELKAA